MSLSLDLGGFTESISGKDPALYSWVNVLFYFTSCTLHLNENIFLKADPKKNESKSDHFHP